MRKEKETNFLSNRSLMRPHPVSGSSGFLMLAGRVLVEEEEEHVCAGWPAVMSAAWTLGSRQQTKKRGLAVRMEPRGGPVLAAPWGGESAPRLSGWSGRIALRLAPGFSGDSQTHGCGLKGCTLRTNSWGANKTLAGTHTASKTQQLEKAAAKTPKSKKAETSRYPLKR